METSDEVAALRARVAELEAQVRAGQEATAMLKAVLSALPAFVIRCSADAKIRFINRVSPDTDLSTVLGTSAYDWMAPSSHERARQAIERAQRTGDTQHFEVVAWAGEGKMVHYQSHVSPLSGDSSPPGFVLAAFDVSVLYEREQAIREREASLRVAVEASGLGLWTWDLKNEQVIWNERMHQLIGTTEPMAPDEYLALVHPDDQTMAQMRVAEALVQGALAPCVYRIVRPSGDVRWMLSLGKILRDEEGRVSKILGGTLDLTEQRRTEEQLRHGQKMEALAQLTAGVAHNFNNMLAVILPTLQGIESLVPEARRPLVRAALMAGERAEELVRRMVQLAGGPSDRERRTVLIEELVQRAVEICRRAFDQAIEIVERYEAPGASVLAAPGDIEQALVNLMINARDALTGVRRPKIVVEVREDEPGWVQARISDNGCGMLPEVQARIFEPFFTTKEPGRGTGLGLATAYASARDHEGDIQCESEFGGGSSFSLRLPLQQRPPERRPPSERPPPPPAPPPLLVVDDEEVLRQTLEWVLADAGYRVLSAASADEALSALRCNPDVALALVDRSMPGGLSPGALLRMRELAPGIRLVLHTGNEPPAELARLVDGVLLKPTRREGLLSAVAEQLRQPPAFGAALEQRPAL